MSGSRTTAPRVPALVEALERIPAEPSAAMRVLWMADDPDASSDDLAKVVAGDPALTSRIMRIANSAYYGLSGRVRSAAFAITVLGFSTVRSLAAAAAAGALDDPKGMPPGFWLQAAGVATSCSLVAPRVGAKHNDAFSLGILHDLGRAILHRTDPEHYQAIVAPAGHDGLALQDAERGAFGIDHAQAAARVLAAWRFPDDLVDAIATHRREPSSATTPLARAIVGGQTLAGLALQEPGSNGDDQPTCTLDESQAEALAVARIPVDALGDLVPQVRRGAKALADALHS